MDILLRIFGIRLVLTLVMRLTGWPQETAFRRLSIGVVAFLLLMMAGDAIIHRQLG